MRGAGLTMAAPTFLPVGGEASCKLSDLVVTGYEACRYDKDEEDYVGGVMGGTFVLNLLGNTGVAEETYYWIDFGTIAAGWYADKQGTAIEGGAESVTIEVGRAAWIAAQGRKLQTSGQVGTSDIAYQTRSLGLSAVGNCTPVDLTLGNLYVNGYTAPYYDKDEEDYVGGVMGGTFVLNLLGPTGVAESTYYWIDFGTISAGWYADKNGTAIEGGATSVSIPTGKGLWVSGQGRVLNIPAPEL